MRTFPYHDSIRKAHSPGIHACDWSVDFPGVIPTRLSFIFFHAARIVFFPFRERPCDRRAITSLPRVNADQNPSGAYQPPSLAMGAESAPIVQQPTFKFSDAEKKKIRSVFDKCDADKNGVVSLEELMNAVTGSSSIAETLGIPPDVAKGTDNGLKDLFLSLDVDGSAGLDPDEFAQFFAERQEILMFLPEDGDEARNDLVQEQWKKAFFFPNKDKFASILAGIMHPPAMDACVEGLDDQCKLPPQLKPFGYYAYTVGLPIERFEEAGKELRALVKQLVVEKGGAYDDASEAAWTSVWSLFVGIMKRGYRDAQADAKVAAAANVEAAKAAEKAKADEKAAAEAAAKEAKNAADKAGTEEAKAAAEAAAKAAEAKAAEAKAAAEAIKAAEEDKKKKEKEAAAAEKEKAAEEAAAKKRREELAKKKEAEKKAREAELAKMSPEDRAAAEAADKAAEEARIKAKQEKLERKASERKRADAGCCVVM